MQTFLKSRTLITIAEYVIRIPYGKVLFCPDFSDESGI